jgi:hypothetical protein
VAWRGDRVPADPQALMNLIRGAASTFSVLLHGNQSGAPGTRRSPEPPDWEFA